MIILGYCCENITIDLCSSVGEFELMCPCTKLMKAHAMDDWSVYFKKWISTMIIFVGSEEITTFCGS